MKGSWCVVGFGDPSWGRDDDLFLIQNANLQIKERTAGNNFTITVEKSLFDSQISWNQ